MTCRKLYAFLYGFMNALRFISDTELSDYLKAKCPNKQCGSCKHYDKHMCDIWNAVMSKNHTCAYFTRKP